MKITVEKLIEMLREYPPDAFAFAYEGEITAVVVVTADGKQLGYIIAEAE